MANRKTNKRSNRHIGGVKSKKNKKTNKKRRTYRKKLQTLKEAPTQPGPIKQSDAIPPQPYQQVQGQPQYQYQQVQVQRPGLVEEVGHGVAIGFGLAAGEELFDNIEEQF